MEELLHCEEDDDFEAEVEELGARDLLGDFFAEPFALNFFDFSFSISLEVLDILSIIRSEINFTEAGSGYRPFKILRILNCCLEIPNGLSTPIVF